MFDIQISEDEATSTTKPTAEAMLVLTQGLLKHLSKKLPKVYGQLDPEAAALMRDTISQCGRVPLAPLSGF